MSQQKEQSLKEFVEDLKAKKSEHNLSIQRKTIDAVINLLEATDFGKYRGEVILEITAEDIQEESPKTLYDDEYRTHFLKLTGRVCDGLGQALWGKGEIEATIYPSTVINRVMGVEYARFRFIPSQGD